MNIDFSAILNSSQYQNDKQKLATTGKKRSMQIWIIIVCLIIPLLWPVLIVLAAKWIAKGSAESKNRVSSMEAFAQANGFEFVNEIGKIKVIDRTEKTYNLPFDIERISNAYALRGSLGGYGFEYTMSSVFVKTSRGASQFPYNLFTINLPVNLPKTFINSKANNLKGLDANAVNFVAAEDHQLEGDFHMYYDVRIEKNEHIDMYTVLTPEVMDTLKRNNNFDVWLSGNQLTLITFADQARYFAGMPAVFENATTLMREIDKIARALNTNQQTAV